MSEKVACDEEQKRERRKLLRRIGAASFGFAVVVLLIFLIVWAVLRPTKPQFTLQDATIFTLNVSSPNVISIVVQITVTARNPNSRIGIYYDKLDAFADYRNQQVTYYSSIPPVYQGHKDFNVWSPFLYGNNVPVAPYNGLALNEDESTGAVVLAVNLNGRVRWKVGDIISGRYPLNVMCPAYIPIGNSKNTGIVVGNAVKYQLSQPCSVNV